MVAGPGLRLTPVPRHDAAAGIGRAAIVSLYDELALPWKPGLVSLGDRGSHDDMDAGTFLRSLFALRRYFVEIAAAGRDGVAFDALEALGRTAEERMLAATHGVNTHRGAIFTLGLLSAAAGACATRPPPSALQDAMTARWGDALAARVTGRVARSSTSNGSVAARRYRLNGVGHEAAHGFPTLFEHALPAFRDARAAGLDRRHAALQALFAAMARLDDTNLVHRGGLPALHGAQGAARAWLERGGAHARDALVRARRIHRDFVARRWSPGGAADVLAAALFVDRITADR